jgi:ubiquinone/menaquinone biosynthesis C-methylase UbiE
VITSISPFDGEVIHTDPLATLDAFNAAYAQDMQELYHTFPLKDGDFVIDIGCGEGSSSFWLAERLSKSSMVMAIDLSASRLAEATANNVRSDAIRFCCADSYQLPFRNGTFDVACCTHSLISLRNTQLFLREVIRIVRGGGWIVAVENDALHHVLLPWPVELEIELNAAGYRAHLAKSTHPWRYYMGRYLPEMLFASGLSDVQIRPWASHRMAPLDRNVRRHLISYLCELRREVAPYLTPRRLAEFDKLAQPYSEHFMVDRPGFGITILDWVIIGKKPVRRS